MLHSSNTVLPYECIIVALIIGKFTDYESCLNTIYSDKQSS